MSNYEELIKKEVNKYMERIEVPRNLGGILMEDFEKVKNEETQKNGGSNKNGGKKVLKGAIAATSAVVLLGAGVFVGSKFFGNTTVNVNNNGVQSGNMVSGNEEDTSVQIASNNNDLVSKLDDTKDWVYDAEYTKNVSADSYSAYLKTYYAKDIVVPYININSVYANNSNSDIKKVFDDAIEVYNNGVSNKMTYIDECNYKKYINNNSLSVVLTYGVGGSDVVHPKYYTYNVDLKTGNQLSYEDAYKISGLDSSNINSKVENAITKIMKEKMDKLNLKDPQKDTGDGGYYPEGTNFDTYNNESISNYKKSISDNTLKYFLSDNGTLNIIVTLSIPVGAGNFDTIITVPVTESETVNYSSDQTTDNTQTSSNTVTQDEIDQIQNFLSDNVNKAFVYFNYNSPEDIFVNDKNADTSAARTIEYSLHRSNYVTQANAEQNKIIWERNGGRAEISTEVADFKDVVRYIKDKTGYEFSESVIKEQFATNQQLNKIMIHISDALFNNEIKVKSVVKDGDRYKVKLGPTFGPDDTDVTLVKRDGTYYFYSCNLNNVRYFSEAEITEVQNFLRDPGNHGLVYCNFESASNLDEKKYGQYIAQSLCEGNYAERATDEQRKIIGTTYGGPVYVISEEKLTQYYEEKLNVFATKSTFNNAFTYNETLGMYVIGTAGALNKDFTVTEAYELKISSFSRYYITLATGQKIVLWSRENGKYIFESVSGNPER